MLGCLYTIPNVNYRGETKGLKKLGSICVPAFLLSCMQPHSLPIHALPFKLGESGSGTARSGLTHTLRSFCTESRL